MNKEFFKRKSKVSDEYQIEIKYCDWGMESDICLAKYKSGEYFIWVMGEKDKIIKSIKIIISIIKRAKRNKLLVPKGLIRKIKNDTGIRDKRKIK